QDMTRHSTKEERELAALQRALAGVHAALWGYGVLGPRLGEDLDRGLRIYHTYRRLRDQLTELIRDQEASPVAAEPADALPFHVDDSSDARRLAVHLEEHCAAIFADLVADATQSRVLNLATRTLTDSAERPVAWGAEPVAFPGLPERR